MLSEAIVIAALGLIGSIVAALVASRAQARTTATGLYIELCKAQQERIGQLLQQVRTNEAEITRLREAVINATARIAELESQNKHLAADLIAAQKRIEVLEAENESLRRAPKSTGKGPIAKRSAA